MNGWSWRGGFGAFFIHHPSRRPLVSLLGLLVGYSVGTVLCYNTSNLSPSSLADAAFGSAWLRKDAAAAAAADQLIACVSCRCAREEEETELFLFYFYFYLFLVLQVLDSFDVSTKGK
jgi:hypothetical protein